MSADTITIDRLTVWSRVGVPDQERAVPQRLQVTLEMEVASFRAAAAADDVGMTVDYARVAELLTQIAARRPRRLIETLGEEMCQEILDAFPVSRVRLVIHKFILPEAREVRVSMLRAR